MTRDWTFRLTRTVAVLATLSLAPIAAAQTSSQAAIAESQQLQALAREATTSPEHAAVARQYRLQAESFAARASEHEANVKRLARTAGPMQHKWPAMAPRDVQREKDRAMAARKASEESRRLADHHVRMSVEALAAAR